MKFRSIFVWVNAIALTISISSATVQAQELGPENQPLNSEPTSSQGPKQQGPQAALLSQLNLTAAQQKQFQHIQAVYKAQLQQILNPTQLEQLKTLGATIDDRALAELKLSSEQQSQLQTARLLADQRFLSILNSDQRSILLKQSQTSSNPNAQTASKPRSQKTDFASPSPPVEPKQPQKKQDPQAALVSQLNLTSEQEKQFQHIQAVYKAQLRQILTPTQVEQLKAQGATVDQQALSLLQLSSAQKSELELAQQLATQRFLSILNPEQQKQLQSLSQKGRE